MALQLKEEYMYFGSETLRRVEEVIAEARDPDHRDRWMDYVMWLQHQALCSPEDQTVLMCEINSIKRLGSGRVFPGEVASSHNLPGSVRLYSETYPEDERMLRALKRLESEGLIKHKYDHAYIMQKCNEAADAPYFDSPQSYINYIKSFVLSKIPSSDSIENKRNATMGKHPQWTFTDSSGKDSTEALRRNKLATRFYELFINGDDNRRQIR